MHITLWAEQSVVFFFLEYLSEIYFMNVGDPTSTRDKDIS